MISTEERVDVALCEVYDVDEITDARTVFCFPVCAGDLDVFAFARDDFEDEGDEVSWLAYGVFAYLTGFVGSDGVEVAQEDCAEWGTSRGGDG